jgi:DNA-binding CsgD family transcriptional regulator/tetratricopeptide (TPR) repeat protein
MSVLAQPELLEREVELEALQTLIATSFEGGRLVAIEGPAGMGKTRLLGEARARAREAGMEVLSARGSELEREFPYGVVRQLFEPILVAAGPEERAELLGGAAALAAPLFDPGAAVQESVGDSSFPTLHGLFWLTANLSERKPLVLAIDDLHWCDPPSLRWLAHVLPRLEGLTLLVLVALRPQEPGADDALMAHLTTDPMTTILYPAPLSEAAVSQLVRDTLTEDADSAFSAACHGESRGNPLLLRELVNAVASDGLAPTASNIPRLRELGAHAVSRAVSRRLMRLPSEATRLARAVAILGDDVALHLAATLAGLDDATASEAASALRRIDILRPRAPLAFVHPVVRAAVYAQLAPGEAEAAHNRAARLLAEARAEPEHAAAQLMFVSEVGDSFASRTLLDAARRALARGAPDSAVSYLRRALEEPLEGRERAEILLELGSVETLVNGPAAAEHLEQALALIEEPRRRAETAVLLARVLYFISRPKAAVDICTRAIAELSGEHPDVERQLEAQFLYVGVMEADFYPLAVERLAHVREREPHDDVGGKMMLALLAYHDARAGAPALGSIERARRALAGGLLLAEDNGGGPLVSVAEMLAVADQEDALQFFDACLAHAHEQGSVFAFAAAKLFRGRTFFLRGALTEAETDAREALEAVESWNLRLRLPFASCFLADALMEQGKLDEAAAALDRAGFGEHVPDSFFAVSYLDSQARLSLLRGDTEQGLAQTLDLGRRYARVGGHNPAFMPWRSQAALALLRLGREDEARRLSDEEVQLARQWGARSALGRATRVAGLVEGGAAGLAYLRAAVDLLERSPARLEHARALADLGAALRRTNRRSAAREPLRRGLELATICGAIPLTEQARSELLATGARPRRVSLTGPDSLTPSERRVAAMAAEGMTNREIAQALFVTTKTVEVHLGGTYRKLGIASRAKLANSLAAAAGKP